MPLKKKSEDIRDDHGNLGLVQPPNLKCIWLMQLISSVLIPPLGISSVFIKSCVPLVWYKKVWCSCKVVVLPCQAIAYFLVAAASLRSYYLRYIVMSQKQNILGANWIAPADSIPNVFFDSSVVPSFLVRKVENKLKFPFHAQAWWTNRASVARQ